MSASDRDPSDPAAGDRAAPVDPRLTWDLPALGGMPRTTRLDELVTRVLAPNPSRMALDGTNTYLLGAPGSGAAALVDPGPPDPGHLARVRAALSAADAQCDVILVTHHHVDHAEAALPWAAEFGAVVAAGSADVAGSAGRVLRHGEVVTVGGTRIRVVATPGHCSDHLAFRLDTAAVLVGDHILGRGTSVVTYPEGDLLAYLESLRRVHDLGPAALYPGHGPEMREDPAAVVEYYLAHRRYRERQILDALGAGPARVAELVATIYADVDRALWPYAEQSTRAALRKLAAEGVVDLGADGTARLAVWTFPL
jgi:glyoxylase-like metal-dependent hydrolase (beta-lactamase superfamily II)